MAQGGYSGQKPSAEQEKQRAEANNAANTRIQKDAEDRCNKRIAEMHEMHEREMAALRGRLAQSESERVMLLRILDAYAQAVTELQALKGAAANTGGDFMIFPQTRGGE